MVFLDIKFKDNTYKVAVKREFRGKIIVEFHNDFPGADSYEKQNKLGLQVLLQRFLNGEIADISVRQQAKVINPGDPPPMMNRELALGRDVSLKDLTGVTIRDVEKLIIDECCRQTSFPNDVNNCK